MRQIAYPAALGSCVLGGTASPLRAADDAVPVDTSELELEQVIIALSELASQRGLLTGCIAEVSP